MKTEDHNRKSAWKAQQRQEAQSAFPLSNALLESLFEAVETRVDSEGCDHTYRFTSGWLSDHQLPSPPILDWLAEHGGFYDCEVVPNARDHWEQN
jgi:hypothetical protein